MHTKHTSAVYHLEEVSAYLPRKVRLLTVTGNVNKLKEVNGREWV